MAKCFDLENKFVPELLLSLSKTFNAEESVKYYAFTKTKWFNDNYKGKWIKSSPVQSDLVLFILSIGGIDTALDTIKFDLSNTDLIEFETIVDKLTSDSKQIKEITKKKRQENNSESGYFSNESPNSVRRATEFLSSLKPAFDSKKAMELLTKKENLTEEEIEEIEKLWDFKREAGSNLHEEIEKFIKDITDETGKLKKSFTIQQYSGFLKNKSTTGSISSIYQLLKNYPKGTRFFSEIAIMDKELDIGGTIDLLIIKPDNTVEIIDFKTKQRVQEDKNSLQQLSKFKKSYSNYNFFDNHVASRQADAEFQTSLYRLILERKGFRMSNDPQKVLLLEGDIKEIEAKKYDNVSTVPQLVTLHSKKQQLIDYFKTKEGKNVTDSQIINGRILNELNIDLFNESYLSIESTLSVEERVKHLIKRYKDLAEENENKKVKFYNQFLDKEIELDFSNDENIKEIRQIFTTYVNMSKQSDNDLSSNIIKYFQANSNILKLFPHLEEKGGIPNSYHLQVKKQIDDMLVNFDTQSHTITLLSDESGFEEIGRNVLKVTNKYTGEIDLIYPKLSTDYNKYIELKYHKDNKSDTILNALMDNFNVDKLNLGYVLPATKESIMQIKLGQIALLLKKQNKETKIRYLITGTTKVEKGITFKPRYYDLATVLPQVKILFKESIKKLEENGEQDKALKYKLFIGDKNEETVLFNAEYYTIDRLWNLVQLLSNIDKTQQTKGKDKDSYQKQREKWLKNIQEAMQQHVAKKDMLDILIQYQTSRINALKRTSTDTNETIANDPELKAINDAILQLNNLLYQVNEDISKMNALVNRAGKTGNNLVERYNILVKEAAYLANNDFIHYKKEHDKILELLITDYFSKPGKGMRKIVEYTSIDISEVFDELYEPDKIVEENGKKYTIKSMKLKNPNDPKWSKDLSDAQKKYIEFTNQAILDNIYKVMSFYDSEKAKKFAEARAKNFEGYSGWKNYQIPITRGTYTQELKQGNYRKALSSYWDRFRSNREAFEEGDVNTSEMYEMFHTQLMSGQDYRLSVLGGYDKDGQFLPPNENYENIENNLEVVSDLFTMSSIRKDRYNSVVSIYNALMMNLYIQEKNMFKQAPNIKQQINKFTEMTIFGTKEEYNNPTGRKLEKLSSNFQAVTSTALIAWNVGHGITEVITGFFNSVSEVAKNTISQNGSFNFVDYMKAWKDITTWKAKGVTSEFDRIESFILEYQLMDADYKALISDKYKKTRGNNFFNSQNLYILDIMPQIMFRTNFLVAQMYHDGVIDAYEFIEDKTNNTASWVYNEEKDKRFKINASDSEKEKARKIAYLNELKKISAKEEGLVWKDTGTKTKIVDGIILDANSLPNIENKEELYKLLSERKLVKAYTFMEIERIRTICDDTFAVEREEDKAVYKYWIIGKLLGQLRGWLQVKYEQYWKTTAIEKAKGKHRLVYNPDNPNAEAENDYIIVWEDRITEGILQSLIFLQREFIDNFRQKGLMYSMKELFNYKDKDLARKENLAKLATDLIIFALIFVGGKLFKDDDENDKLLKENWELRMLYESVQKSALDLNIIHHITGLTTNTSPIVSFSYGIRLFNTLFKVMQQIGSVAIDSGETEKEHQKEVEKMWKSIWSITGFTKPITEYLETEYYLDKK